ncbi:hypothetical protein Igag_1162 [Ignisphaera aggregans DSM 17230]|uniref:Uncharacterized protein n=1 Tax=Ignisphaera aggregans (strain DSM 17230 / JCM 13409 / AQ1.S1) TaxID=583356 RepID=E0SP22_IGNAA|nr:hypothetical protein Igag_1162 [Ignisphaera aggregans DSM 17230]
MSEFKADGISIVYSKDYWYESVNIEALREETKRVILEAVKNKLGFSNACEALELPLQIPKEFKRREVTSREIQYGETLLGLSFFSYALASSIP